jgi:hypothetical protein
MLDHTTRTVYFQWIKNVIADPFGILPAFCDWLDENGVRSQRWREALALLPKVDLLYTKAFPEENPEYFVCTMLTKHKAIIINYCNQDGRVSIRVVNTESSNRNITYLLELGYKKVR